MWFLIYWPSSIILTYILTRWALKLDNDFTDAKGAVSYIILMFLPFLNTLNLVACLWTIFEELCKQVNNLDAFYKFFLVKRKGD